MAAGCGNANLPPDSLGCPVFFFGIYTSPPFFAQSC